MSHAEHGQHPESLMMSYGYDPRLSEGAIKPPIFQSSTFVFRTAEEGKAYFQLAYGLRHKRVGEEMGLIYSRLNNPNLEILEDRLTLWDRAEACAVFESGMAAITTSMLEFLQPGDTILHSEPVYGGTDHFIKHVLPRFGITPVGFHAGASREEMEAALAKARATGPLGMIYLETPANPSNALVDIALCAAMAAEHGTPERRPIVAVDNTFLGPVYQHPLAHGADLVLYSATKYIGGHSDVIAGAALGSAELVGRVKTMRTFLGTMASPWTAWLLLRSLETLRMRMEAAAHGARTVADYLVAHTLVERVYYLGHLKPGDPDFALFERQCLGAGAMISFDIRGGEAEAFQFLDALELVKLAVSLGGTESLAEHPATMTHSDIPPESQARMGISPQMIRLSVGVEHPADIIADLGRAFAAVTNPELAALRR
jgi:methionine-gamma-lyase